MGALLDWDTFVINMAIFGFALMHATYTVYYLPVFIERFGLTSNLLNVVQVLFLIWNAVNDPLMGYMQDIGCGMKWIMDRRKVIFYAGPVFAASFLLFWFPWSAVNTTIIAVQLLCALFLYDTLFTLVISAYCGICVEFSSKHSDRVRLLVWGELMGILAGSSIYPISLLSDSLRDFGLFQVCVIVLALLAGACFLFSGYFMRPMEKTREGTELTGDSGKEEELGAGGWREVAGVAWSIIKEPRFLFLIGSNLFRMLRLMANETFLIIFVENLLSIHGFLPLGSGSLSSYYAVVRMTGSFLFLILWYPTSKLGAQSMIQILNTISLVNGIVALMMGREAHWWISAFILVEFMMCRCGVIGYYMIITGEVIDTDTETNNRKSPLSTLIFTLKALFTKPADQLAPILGLMFLDRSGYSDYKQHCRSLAESTYNATIIEGEGGEGMGRVVLDGTPRISDASCDTMYQGMFQTLVLFPLVCIILESLFVAMDQLYRRRMKTSKMSRTRAESFASNLPY